jgi:hypothetical protein
LGQVTVYNELRSRVILQQMKLLRGSDVLLKAGWLRC